MNNVSLNGTPVTPSKIVCIGRNYADHARELNNEVPTTPVIFMKPNSAISNQLRAGGAGQIHYEGEIAFLVINRQLAGVGFGLDLTNRPLQAELKGKGLPWERSKAFDGSALFSEFVPFDSAEPLRLMLSINGELAQSGGFDLMLFKPEELLREILATFTLEDGDIIMTGTPAGVGPVNRGDHFTGEILSGHELLVMQEWLAL